MARYTIDYQSSFRIFRSLSLSVLLVNISASRRLSSESEDLLYLPSVWFEKTRQTRGCSPQGIRLRFAQFFINENQYLQLPIPFRENSQEYNQFFIQSSINPLIQRIKLFPEIIRDNYLTFWLEKS